MKFVERKISFAATALLLLLVFSTVFAVLPSAAAHDPPIDIPTWSYISASPSTVGLNEPITLVMWLNDYPYTAVGAYGDRWDGIELHVTKPDGTTETVGPFTSDPVGSVFTYYGPDQVGTYEFYMTFPGDVLTGEPVPPEGYYQGAAYINDTYLPSQSDPVFVTAQQSPIEAYPETPLPDGYWTRPIYGANRDWWQVAGNWWGITAPGHNNDRINAYSTGPSTAHVMWTRPYWDGGIMGGETGQIGYYTGLSYETFGLNPPIILNGRLYYNVNVNPRFGWYCLDLRTGEELYFHNTTGSVSGSGHNYPESGTGFDFTGALTGDVLNFGQVLDIELPNQHGGFSYLWSTGQSGSTYGGAGAQTTWRMFDAFTGNYICSIANVSARGTQVVGKDGSILYYNIAGADNDKRLTVWNTTQALWYRTKYDTNQYWMWRPYLNVTFNGNYGFSLNVSIPDVQGSIYEIVPGVQIIGGTPGKNNDTVTMDGNLWALNLDPTKGAIGELLWNKTFTPPHTAVDDSVGGIFGYGKMSGPQVDSANGVFLFSESITRNRWAYDLDTMEQLWMTEEPEAQWQFYGMSTSIYGDKLLSYGYGGELIAYNIRTGDVLWKWQSGTVGFEGYYENTPLSLGAIADDKIYLYSSEHSPSMPLRRDAHMWCVDINDGTLLWKIQCWANNPAIADGYLVALDNFDNQIYCYGKGPSETAVTASPAVIANGAAVMIQGTVTDQSEGAKGTPAISDADQEAWMEYLYQQRPKPTDAVGVVVQLTALDQNGNTHTIGEACSDSNGNYGLTWTPPAEGTYKITATFAGSGAYGSSDATTYVGVGAASATPASPSPVSPSPSEAPAPTSQMPATTYIAIAIAVIVIVAAAAVIILRRR
ncbi:MAG: PQQ-binding-like beta-propeller repeat protein [Candidatus Bathyarchaeota archaeon]|nr:PQQ-binding-like beta-propeller repeat protein [Candidatus Bathyarchaeota archaeon]